MRKMSWTMYLWPGLPQLSGRGSWSALVVAVGAAALLNVALLATFVWTELLTPELRILYWLFLAAAWGFSAGLSGWLRRREQSRTQAGVKGDIFGEALDHYLRGNWFEAERALSRLLRRNRRDVEARLMLATLLRHTRRWDEAARQLDVLVRLEDAGKWELEIRREAELLAAARSGAVREAEGNQDQNQDREEVSVGPAEGAEKRTEPPAEMMHAA
jgi:hypothetical protein